MKKKNVIKLNESKLRDIVAESVKMVLREGRLIEAGFQPETYKAIEECHSALNRAYIKLMDESLASEEGSDVAVWAKKLGKEILNTQMMLEEFVNI